MKQKGRPGRKATSGKAVPLSRLVTVPPKPYSSSNIENDDIDVLENYMPSASTLDIVSRFASGLSGSKGGRMLSITGPYGSGKSTMAVFLKGLFSARTGKRWGIAYKVLKAESRPIFKELMDARTKSGAHQKGLIICAATARKEPITRTIIRALDDGAAKYFGKYTKKSFDGAADLKCLAKEKDGATAPKELVSIITSMCKVAPLVLLIDEFGKSIEYFANDEAQQSDLFLLQELAEMSGPGRKIPLAIITLQHMAFEEYAVGASHARKREWAKIQGRFEDIPFANSPDQTRQLISKTIELSPDNASRRRVRTWARTKAKMLRGLGVGASDPNLIASCYPLDPLALEVIPELCSRYGQHERTLLSFITDGGKSTIATFIDINTCKTDLPTLGLDILYDYFIAGTSMIHASSANISRLMEVETAIRDTRGLDDKEAKALKTIGVLNLIGRSGNLRASQRILDYATGSNSKQVLKQLLDRSLVTYRKHADEYRIWQGTDIDIATNLDTYKKRYLKTPLAEMLSKAITLEPVVAAKHNMQYGTMRIFARWFATDQSTPLDDTYDGVIIYNTTKSSDPKYEKPAITVTPKDTKELRQATIEVMALKEILEDGKIAADWVARQELEERLAYAEINLDRVFEQTYGQAKWSYKGKNLIGTPSSMASAISDKVYHKTPIIHNEMVNRTVLSTQGNSAKRRLLEYMLENPTKLQFGIEGYGPDRAIYEALFIKNSIHVTDSSLEWRLQKPSTTNSLYPVWNEIHDMLSQSKKRVPLIEIYDICKAKPYGVKVGVIDIIVVVILALNKNNIAIYEHGTYSPKIGIELVERLMKNPEHFELKYFKSTTAKKQLLQKLIKDLKINSEGSVLDVVSYLVRTVNTMTPYSKQTKRLDKHSIAVRDTIASANEPDMLLFESLPKALGFDAFKTKESAPNIERFSKSLTKATAALQGHFHATIGELKELLFTSTGIDDRKKLSETAAAMLDGVTDQELKVFLTALSTDSLERDEDWINYVALSLTTESMTSWKDDDRLMFENNLRAMAGKFQRLASMHFAKVSKNFVQPAYQVTVTHADGSEHHNVVSLKPEQKKRLKSMADKIIRDLKSKGFGEGDLPALIALLSSKT